MLIAKFNPPAKSARQASPFSEVETITADCMRVYTEKYDLGATKVRFQVSFGFLIPFGIDRFKFEAIHRDSVELTSEDLSDWGSDDSVVFEKIAPKFNINVVKIEDIDLTNDF